MPRGWTNVWRGLFGSLLSNTTGMCRLGSSAVETLVNTFQRYETTIENKLYRALNQLERLQRIRLGDKIPAPAALDVNVHHERDDVASFGNPPRE